MQLTLPADTPAPVKATCEAAVRWLLARSLGERATASVALTKAATKLVAWAKRQEG